MFPILNCLILKEKRESESFPAVRGGPPLRKNEMPGSSGHFHFFRSNRMIEGRIFTRRSDLSAETQRRQKRRRASPPPSSLRDCGGQALLSPNPPKRWRTHKTRKNPNRWKLVGICYFYNILDDTAGRQNLYSADEVWYVLFLSFYGLILHKRNTLLPRLYLIS